MRVCHRDTGCKKAFPIASPQVFMRERGNLAVAMFATYDPGRAGYAG
jgi:hypothetical protein